MHIEIFLGIWLCKIQFDTSNVGHFTLIRSQADLVLKSPIEFGSQTNLFAPIFQ